MVQHEPLKPLILRLSLRRTHNQKGLQAFIYHQRTHLHHITKRSLPLRFDPSVACRACCIAASRRCPLVLGR